MFDKETPEDEEEVEEDRRGRLSGCTGRPFSAPPRSPEKCLRTSDWREPAFCCFGSGALAGFVLVETWDPLGRTCWGSLRLLRICLGRFWFLVWKGLHPMKEVSLIRGWGVFLRESCEWGADQKSLDLVGSPGLRGIDVEVTWQDCTTSCKP